DVAHGIFAQSSGGSSDDIVSMVVQLDDDGNVVTENLIGEDGMQVLDEFGAPVQVPVWEASTEAGTDLADLGGDINIRVDGDILVNGDFAHAIFAHSMGGDGAGDITIDLLGGLIQGGGNSGVGVRFKGGANNTLNNHGTLTSVDGIMGEAIFADSGNEWISNFGTIIGNVDLGEGDNNFDNNTGAIFESGSLVYLGAGNRLYNTGLLSPGGADQVMTTSVVGDLTLGTTGSLAVNIDLESELTDRLNVSGFAELGGTVDLLVANAESIRPGSGQVTLLTADGGVGFSGINLGSSESAAANYELTPGANDLVLSWDISFAPTGLSGNRSAIGDYINAIQMAGGSSSTGPIVASLYALPDTESLGAAYDLLNPQFMADNQVSTLTSNMQFSDALLSCKVRDGDYRYVNEGDCGWVRVTTFNSSRDDTSDYVGYDEDTWQAAAGMQKHLDDDWVIGGGFSYENRDLALSSGNATSNGRRMQGGFVVKRVSGPTSFSSSFSAGFANYDNARRTIDGFAATGDQDARFFSAQVRGQRSFEFGRAYLKPRLDLGLSYISRDGYEEEGPSDLNLSVAGSSETHVYGQLAMEVGTEHIFDSGLVFRPSAALGFTQVLTDSAPVVRASLLGAPVDAGGFSVLGDLDRTYLDFEFGLDLLTTSDFVVYLGGFGRYSADTETLGGTLKLSFPF
ncbi:MAG: autotransporter domain-containing protein, partial [Gammaproteobacteria bacterium]|nr:autotransporter domain-containing protein [Gammaproteobacteria bacterium]